MSVRWGPGPHRERRKGERRKGTWALPERRTFAERRAVPRSKPGVGSRVLAWVVGMFILEALVALWIVS